MINNRQMNIWNHKYSKHKTPAPQNNLTSHTPHLTSAISFHYLDHILHFQSVSHVVDLTSRLSLLTFSLPSYQPSLPNPSPPFLAPPRTMKTFWQWQTNLSAADNVVPVRAHSRQRGAPLGKRPAPPLFHLVPPCLSSLLARLQRAIHTSPTPIRAVFGCIHECCLHES